MGKLGEVYKILGPDTLIALFYSNFCKNFWIFCDFLGVFWGHFGGYLPDAITENHELYDADRVLNSNLRQTQSPPMAIESQPELDPSDACVCIRLRIGTKFCAFLVFCNPNSPKINQINPEPNSFRTLSNGQR